VKNLQEVQIFPGKLLTFVENPAIMALKKQLQKGIPFHSCFFAVCLALFRYFNR